MAFKFERLEIWRLSLDYIDRVYDSSLHFPGDEKFNLTSQFRRAATSIGLNIAEGSTGQTDNEQVRFLGIALRSLLETVACIHIAIRRGSLPKDTVKEIYQEAEKLSA
jgi:four helix bundle protein